MASFRFRVIAETAAVKLAGRDFTRAGKQAEDALGKANRESKKATSAQEKLAQRVKIVGDRLQRLGSLGNVMTGLVTAGRALIDIYTRLARTLAEFSRHALTSAQRMEDMALSYAAIYDIDLKGGRAAFDRMLEVSKVLPVTTEEYGKALQTLAAFNIADTWEEEQQFLLAMIGASKSLNVELDRVRRAIISLEREPLLNLGVRIDRRGNHARILFRGVVHELEYTENVIRRKLIELFGQEFEEAVTRSRNVITTLRAELSSLNTQLDIAIYDQLEPRIKSLARAFLDWLEVNREFIAIEIAERFNKLLFIAEELVPVFKILASAILAPIDLLLDLTVLAVQGLQDIYKWIKDLIAPFGDWLNQLREAVPLIDTIANFIGRGADFVGDTVGAVGGLRETIRDNASETAGTLAPIIVSADPNINRVRDLVDDQFGTSFIESLSKSIGEGGASGLQTVLADTITGERGLLRTFRDGGKIVSDYIREGFAEGIAKNVSDVFQQSLTNISGNALEPLRQALFGNPDLVGPQNPVGARLRGFVDSPRGQAAIGAAAGGLTLASGVATGSPLTGALGGATLGASLGSIVPGIGTVIGGVVGGIAGALGGIFGGGGKKDPKIELRVTQQEVEAFANEARTVMTTVSLSTRNINASTRELLNSVYTTIGEQNRLVRDALAEAALAGREAITTSLGSLFFGRDEIQDFTGRGSSAGSQFEAYLKGLTGEITASFEPAFEELFRGLGVGGQAINRLVTQQLATLRGLDGIQAEKAGERFLEQIQLYSTAFELTRRDTGIARLNSDITALSTLLGFEFPPTVEAARTALEEIIRTGNVTEIVVKDFDRLIASLQELSVAEEAALELARRDTGITRLTNDIESLSEKLGFELPPSIERAQIALEELVLSGSLTEEAARDFETLILSLRDLSAETARATELTKRDTGIEGLVQDISNLSQQLGFELPPSIEQAQVALEELIQSGNLTTEAIDGFEALIVSLRELSVETERAAALTARARDLTEGETGIAKLTSDIAKLSEGLGFELPPSIKGAQAALEGLIESGDLTKETVDDFDSLITSLRDLSAETARVIEITRRETGVARLAADIINLSQQLGFGLPPSIESAQIALEKLVESGSLTAETAKDFEALIAALREFPAAIAGAINSTASDITRIQSLLGRSNDNVIEALRGNIMSLERSLDSLSENDLAGQEKLLGEIGNAIGQIVSLEQEQQRTLEEISRKRIEGLQEELKGVEALLAAQERASQALLDLQGGQFSPLSGGERLLGIQGQISGLEQSLMGATGIEAAEITNQLTALYTQLVEQAGSIFGAGSLGVSDVFNQAQARLADLSQGGGDLDAQIISIEEAILIESERQSQLTEKTNELLERYLSRLLSRLDTLQDTQASVEQPSTTETVTSTPTEETSRQITIIDVPLSYYNVLPEYDRHRYRPW